jgi:hypothetical protein
VHFRKLARNMVGWKARQLEYGDGEHQTRGRMAEDDSAWRAGEQEARIGRRGQACIRSHTDLQTLGARAAVASAAD